MKKIYFSPEVEVVLLNISQPLLTASDETDDITEGTVPVIDEPTPSDFEEW